VTLHSNHVTLIVGLLCAAGRQKANLWLHPKVYRSSLPHDRGKPPQLAQETRTEAVHVSPRRAISMSLFVPLLEFNPYQRRVAVVILGLTSAPLARSACTAAASPRWATCGSAISQTEIFSISSSVSCSSVLSYSFLDGYPEKAPLRNKVYIDNRNWNSKDIRSPGDACAE
jgi:hypothetical protein